MKQIFTTMLVCMGLMACAGANYPAEANGHRQPNILILGLDEDRDSIPRKNRAFKRVVSELSTQLQKGGFRVYDETTLTLDKFSQDRVRRTQSEIIEIARSIDKTKIDIAVIFTIYPNHKRLSFTTKMNPTINGFLLNVRSGQRLGNFNVGDNSFNLPVECDRNCVLSGVTDNASDLAQDLGFVLTEKLKRRVDGNPSATINSGMNSEFKITLSGFQKSDANEIKEIMLNFRGYRGYDSIKEKITTVIFIYRTISKPDVIVANIEKALDHLNLKGYVTFSGDDIKVKSY